MFQFGGLGAFFGGAMTPKAPRGDGTGVYQGCGAVVKVNWLRLCLWSSLFS